MNKKNGFTLIELLVVVGIIGLLAAIAMPMYQSYIYKSRSSEMLNFAGKLKSDVAEYILLQGIASVDPTSCQNLSDNSGTVSSDVTDSWSITAGCAINVNSVAGAVGGGSETFTLILTPTLEGDGSLSWVCSASQTDYVPSNCK